MAKDYTLEVKTRDVGKHASRVLRREQWAPAVVYGGDTDNTAIAVENKYIDKYRNIISDNPIFILKSKEKNLDGKQVMIKDIIFHPVNHKPTHVDFYAITAGQTIYIDVQIELTGEPQGVKDGGVLSTPHTSVEIECLPKDIPSKITHDISEMQIGDSLHVSQLKVPEGVTILTSDITLATVSEIREVDLEPSTAEGTMDAVAEGADAGAAEGEAAEASEKQAAEGENKE
tara:strand:- start:2208 stop:2897 length:690 start_codon:yes stop_codon:yes gene_type:complete